MRGTEWLGVVYPILIGMECSGSASPPASNVMTDLTGLMGQEITVYYTTRERKVNGMKEKYNDVWRYPDSICQKEVVELKAQSNSTACGGGREACFLW